MTEISRRKLEGTVKQLQTQVNACTVTGSFLAGFIEEKGLMDEFLEWREIRKAEITNEAETMDALERA